MVLGGGGGGGIGLASGGTKHLKQYVCVVGGHNGWQKTFEGGRASLKSGIGGMSGGGGVDGAGVGFSQLGN